MTDVLKELVALAEKATPGPWNPNREGFAALAEDNTVAMRAGPHSLMVGSVGEAFSNVEFACAARNAIPALKALLSQEAELRELAEKWRVLAQTDIDEKSQITHFAIIIGKCADELSTLIRRHHES